MSLRYDFLLTDAMTLKLKCILKLQSVTFLVKKEIQQVQYIQSTCLSLVRLQYLF